ncbi:hypothetical protein EV426DRAFT_575579 [Tirmania nivea]|nr:hypothetical protein EV426DRAFT_575579 [Tirmania nivea]
MAGILSSGAGMPRSIVGALEGIMADETAWSLRDAYLEAFGNVVIPPRESWHPGTDAAEVDTDRPQAEPWRGLRKDSLMADDPVGRTATHIVGNGVTARTPRGSRLGGD